MFLTDSADINRIHVSAQLKGKQRSELGQFFTPAPMIISKLLIIRK